MARYSCARVRSPPKPLCRSRQRWASYPSPWSFPGESGDSPHCHRQPTPVSATGPWNKRALSNTKSSTNTYTMALVVDDEQQPDALEAALTTLGCSPMGLVLVIGAGGDRDTGKRPAMGDRRAPRRRAGGHRRQPPQRGSRRHPRRRARRGRERPRDRSRVAAVVEIGSRRKAISRTPSRSPGQDSVLVAGQSAERDFAERSPRCASSTPVTTASRRA